jgi:predicted outer membrane repeat protein
MTIHVPADAPTIQAGVNLAAPGDTIEVACGTYTAGAVLKDGIVIRSETGLPGCVTIDVVGGTEAFRATDLSQGVVIFGFRMTAPPGSARGMVYERSNVIVRDCEVVGFAFESMIGMGLSMDDASTVTVDRCLFEDNTGLDGGGISCTSSTLTMTDCVMRRNKAHRGGAVNLEFSKVTILNCDFIENEAISQEFTSSGGAIRNLDTNDRVSISDCLFENNFADIGGCIYSRDAYGRDPTSITNSVFRGNSSFNGGSVIYDIHDYASFGGVYSIVDCVFMANDLFVIDAQVQLRKSLFLHNLGECVLARGVSAIENCTFALNTASSGAVITSFSQFPFVMRSSIVAFSGALVPLECTPNSIVTVECCDFYGNHGGDWVGCVAGQENVNGNLSADPLFCDIAHGDLMIQEDSPCAPSNSGVTCDLIGALGVGCGTVSVESKSWGQIKGLYR